MKVEITLSHETDQEIAWLTNREVLFNRGLYSQYVKQNYLKAKQYYKNAILTGVKAKHAVECWLNKMITTREPLLTVLKYLKTHKSLWRNKPEEYRLIKQNIKRTYNSLTNIRKGMLNLMEVYDIDRRKNRYAWENTQLYVRRLLKYDPSVIRVETLYEVKGGITQRGTRNYTTSRVGGKNPIYVVEMMHDVGSCKVSKRRNLSFYYDMVSADNVKVNGEEYYRWLEKAEPQFTILREDLHWTKQITESMVEKMLRGVNFNITPYEEDSDENGSQTKLEAELAAADNKKGAKAKPEFIFGQWDNFRFDRAKIIGTN